MKRRVCSWFMAVCLAAGLMGTMAACGVKDTKESASDSLSETSESSNTDTNETSDGKDAVSDSRNSADGSENAGDEGASVEWPEEAKNSLKDLRELAAGYGAVCAGAYVGFFDYHSYTGEQGLLEAVSGDETLLEKYAFLDEIPMEYQLAYDGEETYCLLPLEDDTELIFYEYTAVDEDGGTDILGDEIWRVKGREPVLFTCNVSDLMSNLAIEVKSGDGSSLMIYPGLSLKDGSTMWPEGVFDFSENQVEIGVGDLVNESGEYEDDCENFWNYSFCLPYVEGPDSEYLERVNAEIAQVYEDYVAEAMSCMEQKLSLDCSWVGYEFGCSNGVYSLLVAARSEWDSTYYWVYHFDEDGNEVTNSGLLEAIGISEDDFVKAADQAFEDYITDPEKLNIDADTKAEIKRVNELTLSPDNCNADMPIFVSDEGRVSFVGRVYSAAGDDHYDHLFTLVMGKAFSLDELGELALDHYQEQNGYRPNSVGCEPDGDTVTIQLFDNMGDHNSTSDWYTIDSNTGKGTNLMGDEVDLTVR